MQTESFWKSTSEKKDKFPVIKQDLETDIVIIGGGITGLTAALQLAGANKNVIVLESGNIGQGTSGYSTGNLYTEIQPFYQSVKKNFNREIAGLVAHSRRAAIDFIEKTSEDLNIDCDFQRRPWYFFTNNKKNISFIEKEVEILKRAQVPVDFADELPVEKAGFLKAAKINGEARFHPLKYVAGLAGSLSKNSNCQIYENSPVTGFQEKEGQVVVKVSASTIIAKKLIIATHSPIGIHPVQTLIYPHRSYVVAAKIREPYPNANIWDIDDPYHAISSHSTTGKDPDMIMVAGNHHKTGLGGNNNHRFREVEAYLRKIFHVEEISHYWSAQHYQPADGLPYIGKSHFYERVYIATGYSADGLTYGTVAGIILSDIIIGNANPWFSLYDAKRFKPLASAKDFVKENLNVFKEYLKDYTVGPDWLSFDEIKKGEGKVIANQGKTLAVYRDHSNRLHILDAKCTHMKCMVEWNNAEKTWDCPCHGSRFSIGGRIIEGPATEPLPVYRLVPEDGQ